MAKGNFKANNATSYSHKDGRTLAAAMLREFSESNADEASIERRYRPGKPQSNILTRYLRLVSEHNSGPLKAGFNAVLTDFLAHAFRTGVVRPEFYERLDDGEIKRQSTAEEIGECADDDTEVNSERGAAPATRRHLTLVHSRD
jgi:hypothetical protein